MAWKPSTVFTLAALSGATIQKSSSTKQLQKPDCLKKCVNYPSILHTEAILPRAERNCGPWIKESNIMTYISNIIMPLIRLPSPRKKKKKG